METNSIIQAVPLQCAQCSAAITPSDRFCGHCGNEIATNETTPPVKQDVLETLTPTLLYYFVNLILLATYKLTDVFPEGFVGLSIISVIDIGLVIIFWGYYFKELKPLFSVSRLNPGVATLTILGAIAGAALVNVVANAIQVSIQDDEFYSMYFFEDTSHPFLWAVLFICVQPAIFEEVTFRGFLHTNLQRVTSARSAIYITAFIFGVIHLSFISMLWLVPLGLIFAFMRVKYNTLWYGIIGHFVYNLSVTIIDYWEML